MSKQFEEYNAKYRSLARTDADESEEDRKNAKGIKRWGSPIETWIQSDVQYAVYGAPDHEEWQKFRCSMKGQSTEMKLWRLAKYRMAAVEKHTGSKIQLKLEKCRVDNYLGALVRGGQLNTKLEIVR